MIRTLLLKRYRLMNSSYVVLLIMTILFSANISYGQTTLIDASGDGGFESGNTFALNGWSSNMPGSTTNNQWVCNTGATPGFTGTRAAYVTNNRSALPPPHTYTNTATRVSHFYRNVTVPAGESEITLNFDWIADAETIWDYMRVWLVPTSYTPNYGTQINAAGAAPTGRVQVGGNFSEQYNWGNANFLLPPAYAGNTFRLVFEWRNDGSLGGNPPAGVDNISLISNVLITPPNDECVGAIGLAVNSDYNCGAVESGTTVNATASPQADDVSGTPNNDVWYSFIATSTAHRISLLNLVSVNGSIDMGIGVYDGNSGCGALLFEATSDPETLDLTGLTIGTTYFVRIYGWYNDSSDQANFDICVGTPPPPPINDDPCNATPLAVNTSCSFQTYTNASATATNPSGIPAPGCANYSGGDVWFTVTVPASGQVILDSDTGVITDGGMAVYSVNSACPSLNLNLIECDDDDSLNGLMPRIELTGQTPGATLFVRFWEYGNNNNGEFDICAYEPTPPPNDDCSNAILLTSDSNCIYNTGTTEYATQSQAGCTGNADDDVWYYFVATGNEHTITVAPNTLNNAVFQVFEGNCGGTSLSCVNNNTTANETLTLSSLTPGTAYYIRIYSNGGNNNQGLFDICITEPCILPALADSPPTCTLIADDTNNDPFATIPFVADPEVSLDCDTGEVTLEAFSNFHETTSYRVERIPYSVNSGLGGGLTSQVIPLDDVWASNSTSIGFDFCFYGQTFTHFLVGANGNITFDINDPANGLTGTNTPGAFCGWQFDENLPSTDGALFNQSIYGVYHDIDPRGLVGAPIQSELVGTGNCRKMVISWTDIPMFDDATRLYSGRIELYESTNIIEVHIEEKLIENNNVNPWNDGNAIVGIQGNSLAGEAITAPCRGIDPNWEVPNTPTTREAWRFVPDGAPRVPNSVTWYTGSVGGTVVGTNNTLTVNTANTYYVEATYPTCSGNITVNDAIIVRDPRKIWDGSVDNNWYEAHNWTPVGIPTLNDCVVIPDQATTPNDPIANQLNAAPLPLTTPAMARNLTLHANAYLEVETNTELLVREWVNVNNTGIFNINSSGSLIQMEDSAVNTGVIHLQRSPNFDQSAVANTEYVYWSSPVSNFQVTNISPSSTAIYNWIPTVVGNGAGNHGEWSASSGIMDNATGYIVRGLGGTPASIPATTYTIPNNTALFSGVPNNGIFTKQVFHGNYNGAPYAGVGNTATNEDDNWNLLGNPYPSAISANAFTNLNTNINGTVYLWPHSSSYSAVTADPFYEDYVYNYDGNDYIEHNNTGSNPPGSSDLFIGSSQGFFVLMNHTASSGSNVIFNNSMRYDSTIDDLISNYDNSNFFRMNTEESMEDNNAERHRIWLDLLGPNQVTNSILVGYVENATNDFDRLFDGYDFSDDNTGFYSILEDSNLSIQGRALPFSQEDIVPLGVVANSSGSHTIAINTVDGLFLNDSQSIFIEDLDLGIIHDLRSSPYTFTISEGVHNNRFVLRYTDDTLSVESIENLNGITIIAPDSKYIKVTSADGLIDSVALFDITGRIIYESKDTNMHEFIYENRQLSAGTYIVKVKLQNEKHKIQKVVIRN